ncbi:MAG: hypothetical protein RSF90_05505 [Pygmaiobacter sp.]
MALARNARRFFTQVCVACDVPFFYMAWALHTVLSAAASATGTADCPKQQ